MDSGFEKSGAGCQGRGGTAPSGDPQCQTTPSASNARLCQLPAAMPLTVFGSVTGEGPATIAACPGPAAPERLSPQASGIPFPFIPRLWVIPPANRLPATVPGQRSFTASRGEGGSTFVSVTVTGMETKFVLQTWFVAVTQIWMV